MAEAQRIHKNLLVYLVIGFIATASVSVFVHESGHYFVARLLGYHARISIGDNKIALGHTTLAPSDTRITPHDNFLIMSGGPVITMLSGTIGFILLLISCKSFPEKGKLTFLQWVLVFLSMFWIIEILQIMALLTGYFINGHFLHFDDEVNMASYLSLYPWVISASTAIAGLVICLIIFFKITPQLFRLTFLLAGFTGLVIVKIIAAIIMHSSA